ncbi:hypothetical protein SBI_03229 [Streptomyces bingchenggensis BCW-1]|uniref:DUF397 domain-containing protein n=1 Tax=Streptomyces bingchenggensis (strain BCW-1) TaxID=749414 RepID=D7C8G1_STRBB|nr:MULTISPECIES: DUF397 domain-containing protein [Streptomyces]ADI06350.1 hypothetical protein SBI_03229 [Streptomyces bingchenggensis BCW-1]
MSTSELAWFKSSYSSGGDGDCVEMATCSDAVHVRDSKDKEGPQLAFSPSVWTDFVAYATKP